jgi:hypothetical protein
LATPMSEANAEPAKARAATAVNSFDAFMVFLLSSWFRRRLRLAAVTSAVRSSMKQSLAGLDREKKMGASNSLLLKSE